MQNLSKDVTLWRKWAMDKIKQWSGKTSCSQAEEPHTSIVARRTGPENYPGFRHVSDDRSRPSSPLPELSPGSSAPGTSDSLLDPPTPTPGSRIRKGRDTPVQAEAILEASPTDSTISFSTTTDVESDSQITLVESTHANAKSKDIFYDSMPGAFHPGFTTE
ncbi:hypothetical protein BDV10DRAFT_184871 [Aspergillus recurvatus]